MKRASALDGITVLEFASVATAPLGRMLADLGADVQVVGAASVETGSDASADVAAFLAVCSHNKTQRQSVSGDEWHSADIVLCSDPWSFAWFDGATPWHERPGSTILVTVTPFGASGPGARRPSSDLVNIAQSGYLYMTGEEDSRPIKPTVPFLSWRHAGNHALIGVMLALRERRLRNRAVHVDVSARDTGLWMLTHTYQYWEMERINLHRKGASRDVGKAGTRIPSVYACKDGTIVWMLLSGQLGKASLDKLVDWMDAEGMAPDELKNIDWQALRLETIPDIDVFMSPFARFFLTKTKSELLDRAIRDGFMIAPADRFEDVLSDPQLEARGLWAEQTIDGKPVRMPRSPVLSDGWPWPSEA